MSMKKIAAAIALTTLLGLSATACADDHDHDTVVVYQMGYYDGHHVYHAYPSPHQTTVSKKQYDKNAQLYKKAETPKASKTVEKVKPTVTKKPKPSSTKR